MNVSPKSFGLLACFLLTLAWTRPVLTLAATAPAETAGRIQNLRRDSERLREQVALTLEKLKRVRNQDRELEIEFRDFKTAVKRLEDFGLAARAHMLAMEGGAPAYFKAWEEQIDSIKDPKTRAKARTNYQDRLKAYNRVIKALSTARDHLKLFLADLANIQVELEKELKAETLTSQKELFKSAKKNGNNSLDALEDFEAELDKTSEHILKYFQ